MYDVDGNGVIDQDEMTKIVQVDKYFKHWTLLLLWSMRKCDDIHMTRTNWHIDFSGDLRHAGGRVDQATGHCWRESQEYLQQVFEKKKSFQIYTWAVSNDFVQRMDENNDGTLTEEEFLKGCLLVTKIFSHLIHQISHISDNYQIQSIVKQV